VQASRSELLRVVSRQAEGSGPVLVADPRRREPGRGAHLHPTIECLALAERRRAFVRALRLDQPPDLEQLRHYVTPAPTPPEPHPGPP
jgi:predicted RNA-binding protein YlxR (DUF448 family)